MRKPVIKILDGPSPTQTGISNAVLPGLAQLASALSNAADLYPHDIEGLHQILHFRNHIAETAHHRARWFGGRLYNRFSGEDAEYIPLSGTHLRQTLGAVGIQPPDVVKASGKYQLRLDISKQAAGLLLAELSQTP